MVIERFMPAWKDTIEPVVKSGEKVIIAAHGNSLRALVMFLKGLSKEEVLELNIPTGTPLVLHLDENLKCIKDFYLGDAEAVAAKAAAVAAQAAGAKK